MSKHKNLLPLYILGLLTAVVLVAVDMALVILVGICVTMGVEDPLKVFSELIKLAGNLLSRSIGSIKLPIGLLAAIGVLVILAVAAFFIGGYFKRNSDIVKIKTYDKNKNTQSLGGIAGVKRPELTNFWVGAARIYPRALAVTMMSAVTLIAFMAMSVLAIIPTVTVISRSGSIKGFQLILSSILALISVWVVLLVFVLIKIYIIGFYKGMVMYSNKFIRKSINSVNTSFMRRYTDYLILTVIYVVIRAVLLWVCSAFSVQLARANVMPEIYILDGLLKVGYLLLVNRMSIGEQ